MRKVLVFLALVAASMYLASYVELNSNIRSGPIVVSSMDSIYVFVSPDDGHLRLFKLTDLDMDVPSVIWNKSLTSTNGIPSTGAHVYWEEEKANYILLAPKNVGLKVYYFGYKPSDYKDDFSPLNTAWEEISGGVAAFTASHTTNAATFIAIAVDEMGYLRASLITASATDSVDQTQEAKERISTGGAYSTPAVKVTKDGSAVVYFGTDEGVHKAIISWDYAAGTITIESTKTFVVSGVAQSGFAMGTNYVYFLTYAFDKAYFYVMNMSSDALKRYVIDVPEGEAVAGYPTNSPVVATNGTEETVYIALGKAVYYYTDDGGLQKYADIGETIYAAPVLVSNVDNPLNTTLVVVTGSGKVYKVTYNNPVEIPSPCAGMGQVYAPPIARGGRLIFGVSTPDGNGYLCSVDISSVGSGVPNAGWPAFGYADARSQVSGENPPFKIPVYLKGLFTNGSPLDTSVEASYAIYEDSNTTPNSTGIISFNGLVDVTENSTLEVYASDLVLDTWDTISGSDVWYKFDHWVINGESTTTNPPSETIENAQIWEAYYTKKYKVYIDYINVEDNKKITSAATYDFYDAGTTLTIKPNDDYYHVKWVIQKQGEDPVEDTENLNIAVTVDKPIYIKEYVHLVYGKVKFRFPKYLFEPVSNDTFILEVNVATIATNLAGDNATTIKAFYVNLDLSSLPFEVHVKDVDVDLNLENATPETAKIAQIFQINDKGFEYVVTLSTPIELATNVFVATVTATYTGVSGVASLDGTMNRNMIKSGVGDSENNIGIFNVLLANTFPGDENPPKGEEPVYYIPDYYVGPGGGILGDFVGLSLSDGTPNGCVDGWDMLALMARYGIDETSPDWDPRYDIGPREGFVPPESTTTFSTPGYLIPETPRKIDFKDILIEALMYGFGCN